MASALILCRTPLQARIFGEVIKEERVKTYDLIYFTQHNSVEDQTCFESLAANASYCELVYLPPSRFDIFNHMNLWAHTKAFRRDLRRDLVIVGSLNNIIFNAIIRKQRNSQLVTIDDGAANFEKNGIYRRDRYGGRADIYRLFLGAASLSDTRKRISRHYTLFPGVENIVPREQLRVVSLGFARSQAERPGPVFFIGQPFTEVLTAKQIDRMTTFLRSEKIDYYVPHPRETTCLDIGALTFDKRGLIAEEAILRNCAGAMPTIVSLHSSVLFSLSPEQANKRMLVFPESESGELIEIGVAAGCSLIRIT